MAITCHILSNEMMIKRIDEDNERDTSIALEKFRSEIIGTIERLFRVHIEDRSKRLDWKTWGIDALQLRKYHKLNRLEHNQTAATNSNNLETFEGFALVITGSTLTHAMSDNLQMKFLELCMICKAVVCSRMTPVQKAQIVDLVRKNENKITLAIGDGANDVSMLHSKCFSLKSNEMFVYFQKHTLALASVDKKDMKQF